MMGGLLRWSDERPEGGTWLVGRIRRRRLRCGWCSRVLRPGHEPESTGICTGCAETYLTSLEES